MLRRFRKRREPLLHRRGFPVCLIALLPLSRPKSTELLTPIGIDLPVLLGKLLPSLIVFLLRLPRAKLFLLELAFFGLLPRRLISLVTRLKFRFDFRQPRGKRRGIVCIFRLAGLNRSLGRIRSVGCLFGFGCNAVRRRRLRRWGVPSVEFTRLIETGDNVIKLVSQTSFLTDTTYLMYATSL